MPHRCIAFPHAYPWPMCLPLCRTSAPSSLTFTPAHTLYAVPLSPRSLKPVRGNHWISPKLMMTPEKALLSAMSQSLPRAAGCGNTHGGPQEGASAFHSRAGIGTRQLAGDKAGWRVMAELRFCPQTEGKQGMLLGKRGTCVLERSSDHRVRSGPVGRLWSAKPGMGH